MGVRSLRLSCRVYEKEPDGVAWFVFDEKSSLFMMNSEMTEEKVRELFERKLACFDHAAGEAEGGAAGEVAGENGEEDKPDETEEDEGSGDEKTE